VKNVKICYACHEERCKIRGVHDMKLLWEEIQSNAIAFSKRWKGADGRERQQAQTFVREFLAVFGIDDPLQNGAGEFEYAIKGN